MSEEKKREALKKIYLENISEAFSASKETGVYINCEFDIDLEKKEVFHALSSTNGEEVVVIQKDRFPYDDNFKKRFLEPSLASFATNGVVTMIKVHDHSVDPIPSSSATLRSISSGNNIISIKKGEIDYVRKIETTLKRIRDKSNNASLSLMNGSNGIINTIILSFLVGVIGGTMITFIFKFFIK